MTVCMERKWKVESGKESGKWKARHVDLLVRERERERERDGV